MMADDVRTTMSAADVPCEAPYTATYRAVATERFDDFRALFDAATAAALTPATSATAAQA